jgi:hypothetical protein
MPPTSGGPSRRTRVTGPIWTRSSGSPGRQRSAQNCPGWPETAGVEGEVWSACRTACRRSRLRRRPMTTITIRASATPANQADSIVRPGEPSCSSMLSGSESADSVGASLTQGPYPVAWWRKSGGRRDADPLAGRISAGQGRTETSRMVLTPPVTARLASDFSESGQSLNPRSRCRVIPLVVR